MGTDRRLGQREPRRRLGALFAVPLCAGLLLVPPPSPTQARQNDLRRARPEPSSLRSRRREAIERGCAYLAAQQNPQEGSFGETRAIVAITALATLALMSEGSTDHRGPYRDQIRGGINFLLQLVEREKPGHSPDGYFFYPHDEHSRMHGQGYATLALACALGTSEGARSRRIRAALERAVACIEQAQSITGGFGYNPTPQADHEGSVTVTVAQGLRAARDAGVRVSEPVVRRGLRYLRKSQRSDGSFQYSIQRQVSSYALTAAALSSFFLYGHYEDDASRSIERGLRYLRDEIRRGAEQNWYYYGHFYAAWALWQWDGADWSPGPDRHWGSWVQVVYPDLLGRQDEKTGAFEKAPGQGGEYGPILDTSLAVLTLGVPDESLPVFQR